MDCLTTIASMKYSIACITQQLSVCDRDSWALSCKIQYRLFHKIVALLLVLLQQPYSPVNEASIVLLYRQLVLFVRPTERVDTKPKQRSKRQIENYHSLTSLKNKLMNTLCIVSQTKTYHSQHLIPNNNVHHDVQLKKTNILAHLEKYQEIVNGKKSNAEYVKLLRRQISGQIDSLETECLQQVLYSNHANIQGEVSTLAFDQFHI